MTADDVVIACAGLLRTLDRNAIRLDDDWPEEEFQRVKAIVEAYLYPDEPVSPIDGSEA